MQWLTLASAVFYYILVAPILQLSDWVFLALAPILHLLHYALHALYVPLGFVARFETLYIYLGVAALVGILTGSVLHFTSSVLISALGLRSRPKRSARRPAARRPGRPRPLRPKAGAAPRWQNSDSRALESEKSWAANVDRRKLGGTPKLTQEYVDWLVQQETDTRRRKKRSELRESQRGSMPETILEEESGVGEFDFV
ncbi:MAG: 37S ribosomal protein S9, mitochondrial [Chaenotheca gracillima]|nr:MAG: 37S ribosomal protein S9, mitochondrial [Chaenotheca gracillima]